MHTGTTYTLETLHVRPSEASSVSVEGIIAGLVGAATISLWFLILDTLAGRPFYTPMVLGSTLLRRADLLAASGSPPVSFEIVVFYTWIHVLIFCFLGGIVARLLAFAERQTNLGFGILLLFVVFECGFIGGATLFAETILQKLAWISVLLGNVLAAAAMASYFKHRHPHLTIEP